ncbi:hypothetical protein VKT23_009625 [Stygiomarasmius scandens]|uniref:Uncharacterized protein n=1 Tax=Marasmiellus scandens TaxID=2682957 RepID=A0ABR1JEX4_9AGAR
MNSQSDVSSISGRTSPTLSVSSDMEKGKDCSFDYELPPFIKSLKEGWHTSLQAAAVVSTLLAQTAAQFLGTVKDGIDDHGLGGSTEALLLIASYGGIIFGYSATISSLCLNDRLAALPCLVEFETFSENMPQLRTKPITTVLDRAKAGRRFKLLYFHCK